jgi:hypothetical protein
MGNNYSNEEDLEGQLQTHIDNLNKAVRKLKRDILQLDKKEILGKKKIKLLYKQKKSNRMIMLQVKEVASIRSEQEKRQKSISMINNAINKLDNIKTTNKMSEALEIIVKTLAKANKLYSLPHITTLLAQYEYQENILNTSENIMGEVFDIFEDDDDERIADESSIINSILDEMGIQLQEELNENHLLAPKNNIENNNENDKENEKNNSNEKEIDMLMMRLNTLKSI